jgi:hypothetical protein
MVLELNDSLCALEPGTQIVSSASPKSVTEARKIRPRLSSDAQWFFSINQAQEHAPGQSFAASNNRPLARAALHFWARSLLGVGDNQASLQIHPHRVAGFIYFCKRDSSIYSYIYTSERTNNWEPHHASQSTLPQGSIRHPEKRNRHPPRGQWQLPHYLTLQLNAPQVTLIN